MVQHRINISRMRYRAQFGHYEATDKLNPNTGKPIKAFKPEFSRWAGSWSLTNYDTLKVSGSLQKDSAAFFIRHDMKVTDDYILKVGAALYSIDHIQRDEDVTGTQFDTIYCHKYGDRKHG